MMPEPLIWLGLIVLGLCLLTTILDGGGNPRRRRERDLRTQMLIEQWRKEHPE